MGNFLTRLILDIDKKCYDDPAQCSPEEQKKHCYLPKSSPEAREEAAAGGPPEDRTDPDGCNPKFVEAEPFSISTFVVINGWGRVATFICACLAFCATWLDTYLNDSLQMHTLLKGIGIVMLINETIINTEIPFGLSSHRNSFGALFRTPRYLRLAFLYMIATGTEVTRLSMYVSRQERVQEVELYKDFVDSVGELIATHQKVLFIAFGIFFAVAHLLKEWTVDDYHYYMNKRPTNDEMGATERLYSKQPYHNDWASNILWYERRENRWKGARETQQFSVSLLNWLCGACCIYAPAVSAWFYFSYHETMILHSSDNDRYYSYISFMAIAIALVLDGALFLLTPMTIMPWINGKRRESTGSAAWRDAFRRLIRPRNGMQHLKTVHLSHIFINFYLASFIQQHTEGNETTFVYGGVFAVIGAWAIQRLIYAKTRDFIPRDFRLDQIIARCLQSFAIIFGTYALIFIFLGVLGPFLRMQTFDGDTTKIIKRMAKEVMNQFDEFVYYMEEMANNLNPFCSRHRETPVECICRTDAPPQCSTNDPGLGEYCEYDTPAINNRFTQELGGVMVPVGDQPTSKTIHWPMDPGSSFITKNPQDYQECATLCTRSLKDACVKSGDSEWDDTPKATGVCGYVKIYDNWRPCSGRVGDFCTANQLGDPPFGLKPFPDEVTYVQKQGYGYNVAERRCLNTQCNVFLIALTASMAAQAASSAVPFIGAALNAIAQAVEYALRMAWQLFKIALRFAKIARRIVKKFKFFKKAYRALKTASEAYKKLFKINLYTMFMWIPAFLNGFVSLSVGYWQRIATPGVYPFFLAFAVTTTICNLVVVLVMFIGPFYVEYAVNYILPDTLGRIELEMKHGYNLLFLGTVLSYVSSFAWTFYLLLYFFESAAGSIDVAGSSSAHKAIMDDEEAQISFSLIPKLWGKGQVTPQGEQEKQKLLPAAPKKAKARRGPRKRPKGWNDDFATLKDQTTIVNDGLGLEEENEDHDPSRYGRVLDKKVIRSAEPVDPSNPAGFLREVVKIQRDFIYMDTSYGNSFGQWLNCGVWTAAAAYFAYMQISDNAKIIEFYREPKQNIVIQVEPFLQARGTKGDLDSNQDEFKTLCDVVGTAMKAALGYVLTELFGGLLESIGDAIFTLIESIEEFLSDIFVFFHFDLDFDSNQMALIIIFSPTIVAVAVNVLGLVICGVAEWSAFGFRTTRAFMLRWLPGFLSPLVHLLVGAEKTHGASERVGDLGILGVITTILMKGAFYTRMMQFMLLMCGSAGLQLTFVLIGFKAMMDSIKVPIFEFRIMISDFTVYSQIANMFLLMAFVQTLIDGQIPLEGTPRAFRVIRKEQRV